MRVPKTLPRIHSKTPANSGVFLCTLLCCFFPLLLSSCDSKTNTPEWDQPGGSMPSRDHKDAPTQPASASAAAPAATAEATPADPTPADLAPQQKPAPRHPEDGLRFMTYTVWNWLSMDRNWHDKVDNQESKPEEQKAAVIRLIIAHQPDILGLCEIGTAADLAEIQHRLKAGGLDLPHSHYTGGTDETRHLGILSRYPITATAKPAETQFELEGKSFGINRGILDATIVANGKSYRFLGAHLKSKREIEDADQEQMRIREAHLLRRHADSIFAKDPDVRLIAYGDFNDYRNSEAVKTVLGAYRSPEYLTAIPFKDSRDQLWTHHWSYQDVYSRIDFVTVSKTLRSEIDKNASYIVDDDGWRDASDHRPIVAIFR